MKPGVPQTLATCVLAHPRLPDPRPHPCPPCHAQPCPPKGLGQARSGSRPSPTMPCHALERGSAGLCRAPSPAQPCPALSFERLCKARWGSAERFPASFPLTGGDPQRIFSSPPRYLLGKTEVGKQEPLGTAGQKISARAALALVPPPTWPKGPGSGPPKPGLGPWSKASRPI